MDKVIAALEKARPKEEDRNAQDWGNADCYNHVLQCMFDNKVITHEQYTRLRIHEA